MKTIMAIIPQIIFDTIHFEVTDEVAEEIPHMLAIEKAKLCMEYMSTNECDWMPQGQKGFADALEMGYAKITIEK